MSKIASSWYQEVISRKPYPSSMIINTAGTPFRIVQPRIKTGQALTKPTLKSGPGGDYPCLCLCFGFSQITLMRPFLLMILHFSHIGFTDDLTFTLNPPFKKDHFIF
jgi:hypothetical protein